jgi:hypothetical protein
LINHAAIRAITPKGIVLRKTLWKAKAYAPLNAVTVDEIKAGVTFGSPLNATWAGSPSTTPSAAFTTAARSVELLGKPCERAALVTRGPSWAFSTPLWIVLKIAIPTAPPLFRKVPMIPVAK